MSERYPFALRKSAHPCQRCPNPRAGFSNEQALTGALCAGILVRSGLIWLGKSYKFDNIDLYIPKISEAKREGKEERVPCFSFPERREGWKKRSLWKR
jgi:hypothetical protein